MNKKGQIILASNSNENTTARVRARETGRSLKRVLPNVLNFNFRQFGRAQQGQIILEVVIGIAVAAFFIVGAAAISAISLTAVTNSGKRNQAVLLAQSTMDELKIVRDSSWTELEESCTSAAPCKTSIISNSWAVEAGSESHSLIVGSTAFTFSEKLILDPVNRDGNGNIVTSGGVADPSTRKATSCITWDSGTCGGSNSVQIVQYLTRHKNDSSLSATNNSFQTNWVGGVTSGCNNTTAGYVYSSGTTTKYCTDDGSKLDSATAGQLKLK